MRCGCQAGKSAIDERHALAPDCMAEVGRKLTTADINAVASWLAVQPIPADPHPLAEPRARLPLRCSAMNP